MRISFKSSLDSPSFMKDKTVSFPLIYDFWKLEICSRLLGLLEDQWRDKNIFTDTVFTAYVQILTWQAMTLALVSIVRDTTLSLASRRMEPAFLHLKIL